MALLRRIKNTQGLSKGNSSLQYISNWSNLGEGENQSLKLKFALSIIEQVNEAENYIKSRNLHPEAEEGLMTTIIGVRQAFALEGFQTQIAQFIPSVETSISSFSMLVGIMKTGSPDRILPEDVSIICSEMQALLDIINNSSIPYEIRATVSDYIKILIGLVNNVQIVGADSALFSFFEMMKKIHKSGCEDEIKEAVGQDGWEQMKKWGSRINSIGEAVSGGAKFLEGAKVAFGLIS